MNKTFIDMLTAINEPEAIERAYQIMAAKRDLLAYAQAYTPKVGDYVRLVNLTPEMHMDGFTEDMTFTVLRVYAGRCQLKLRRVGGIAIVKNEFIVKV